MSKIVLLSWHYYNSKRKAGFHFLADSFAREGHDVTFVSACISLLTLAKRKHETKGTGLFSNLVKEKKYGKVNSIVNFSLTHNVNSRFSLVEKGSSFFYRLSKTVKNKLKQADYIIFESCPCLLFFNQIKEFNSKAEFIYRMSDDIELAGGSQSLVDCEREIIDQFDLVSVPTKVMYDKFVAISPNNVKLHFHGVDKSSYNSACVNPYEKDCINHVFVGNNALDEFFISTASEFFPDHLFHIIGPFNDNIRNKNVIYYGQRRFIETVPFVKYASTGLHTVKIKNEEHLATMADTLKVLQYTSCKLPIIAPSVVPAFHRNNVIYYEYDNRESIISAVHKAISFDRSTIVDNVLSWDELSKLLLSPKS